MRGAGKPESRAAKNWGRMVFRHGRVPISIPAVIVENCRLQELSTAYETGTTQL
jgi:hypothetical protein